MTFGNNRIRIHLIFINNMKQLSLVDEDYSNPDSNIKSTFPEKPKPTQAKAQPARQAIPEPKQPFLPGMSRRGRPRSESPVPPGTRASESRKRRMEAGIKRVELLLEPAVMAELDTLVAHFKTSRVEVISRLIDKAARRIRDKPSASRK